MRGQTVLLLAMVAVTCVEVCQAARQCSASHPCQHGGTCASNVCICAEGYTGIHCQSESPKPTTAAVATTKPAPATCAPVFCLINCPGGYEKDDNGCQICKCKTIATTATTTTTAPKHGRCPSITPVSGLTCASSCSSDSACGGTKKCCTSYCQGTKCLCPDLGCKLLCSQGFQQGKDGCNICACARPKTSQPPTTTPQKPTCSPIACLIHCPFGKKTDANGCELCQCKTGNTTSAPPKHGFCPTFSTSTGAACSSTCSSDSACPGTKKCCKSKCQGMMCLCPALVCKLLCPLGYEQGKDGCNICSCAKPKTTQPPEPTPQSPVTTAPKPTCSPIACLIHCPFGKKTDANGCELCQCKTGNTTSAPPKHGFCPTFTTSTGAACSSTCSSDSACPGTKKCCKSKCQGMMCLCPALVCKLLCPQGYEQGKDGCNVCSCAKPKTTQPPAPTTQSPATTAPKPTCSPIACLIHCPFGKKTDANGCELCQCKTGNTTSAPPKHGFCPTFTTSTGAACSSTCSSDSACPGTKKCCKSKCQGMMCLCPALVCKLLCPLGYEQGKDGCNICSCAKPKTTQPPTPITQSPVITTQSLTLCEKLQIKIGTPPPRRGKRAIQKVGTYYPTCENDGEFSKVQCPPSGPVSKLSDCFCVNTTTGRALHNMHVEQRNGDYVCVRGAITTKMPVSMTTRPVSMTTRPVHKTTSPVAVTTTIPGCPLPNGTIIQVGVKYKTGPCTTCVCHTAGRHPACRVTDCPPMNCPSGQVPIWQNGACCATCQPNSTTSHTPTTKLMPMTTVPMTTGTKPPSGCRLANGTMVRVGTYFNQGPCTNCQCMATGRSVCSSQSCLSPSCPPGQVAVRVPNVCCPVCRKNSTVATQRPTTAAPTCPPPKPCPWCPNGYVYRNGCQTCQCKPAPGGCAMPNGTKISVGEKYLIACHECTCVSKNNTRCLAIECPVPVCRKDQVIVRVPGYCCPRCQSNATSTTRSSNTTSATTAMPPTGCPGVPPCVPCLIGYHFVYVKGCMTCSCARDNGTRPTIAPTTQVPVIRLHMELNLAGTEEATAMLLSNADANTAFKLYFMQWLQAQYSLSADNIQEIEVFSLLSSRHLLVTYNLVGYKGSEEPVIRNAKQKIDSDVQFIEPNIKVPFNSGYLQFSLQPSASSQPTEAPGNDKNTGGSQSSGLSSTTVIAISVGGGVAVAAIIVMLIVMVKARSGASRGVQLPSDLGQATYSVKGDISINSSSPNFDEPLYDSDTRGLVTE